MMCGDCGTAMEKRKENRHGEEVMVYRCNCCGLSFISLEDASKIHQRLLGPIEEEQAVVKIGNSIGVTLPQGLKKIFKLGDKVKVRFNPETMEVSVKLI